MRYIPKKNPPEYLEHWKEKQEKAGLPLYYDDFPHRPLLNKDLRQEQHNICCYCQRRVDHFQGDLRYGSHNEHLYPENIPGDAMSLKLQVEYSNIYACCIDSRGFEKRLQHCGEAKSNKKIPHLIQDPNCSSFFRYNILGEIIPNGKYMQWNEYEDQEETLSAHEHDAFLCIKTLKLNCLTLKQYRHEVLQTFITIISTWTAEKIKQYIHSYDTAKEYQELVDMKLQYMRQRLQVLRETLL